MIAEMYIDNRANIAEITNNLFKLGGRLIRSPQKLVTSQETLIQLIFNFPSSVTKQKIVTTIKPNVKGKKAKLDLDSIKTNIPGAKTFKLRRFESYPFSINDILSTNKN